MIPKKLIPAIAMLMLCGAGCFSKGAENAVNPSGTGTETEKTTSTANVDVEGKTSGDASSTLVAIDDTWKTYQSSAGGYSFRYPTKGVYAPQWEVKYYDERDLAPGQNRLLMKDGCVEDSSYLSKSTFNEFCHSWSVIEMGDTKRIDYYAVKKGNKYLAFVFTKKTYSDNSCPEPSLSKSSCISQDSEEYQAVLNTSMSTFKFDE